MATTNTTAADRGYEVNADGRRHYRSRSAAAVGRMAAAWRKDGHSPRAYAVIDDGAIRIVDVPVTTARETAAALAAAN
jgi:hypothetical protein